MNMPRTVVDIDTDALEAARVALGTRTIKDTVNAALRQAGTERRNRQMRALDAYPGEDSIEEFLAWRRGSDGRTSKS